MRISRIFIRNVIGVESLDMPELGAFTVIKGDNGLGKTSVVEAIRAVVGGGYDATLLANGADEGETVLVLDDGTEITKPIGVDKQPSVKNAEGKKVKGPPVAFIRSLFDTMVFNPITFLKATEDQQLKMLLMQLDIRITEEDLAGLRYDPSILGMEGLQPLEALQTAFYNERRELNRVAKEKRASADQLRKAAVPLPEDDGRLEALRNEKADIDNGLSQKKAEVGRILADANAQAERDAASDIEVFSGLEREQINELKAKIAELQQQVAVREAELQGRVTERKAALAATLAENRGFANDQYQAYSHAQQERRQAVTAEIAVLEQVETQRAAQAAHRQMMEQFDLEAAENEAKSEALTASLDKLQEIRRRKMEALPIKGIEIKEGKIYQDGILLNRLNETKQVALVLRIVKHRAEKLKVKVPLVVIDGIEFMSPKTFEAFKAAAPHSGLQFIVTRVSSDPQLVVETE